MKMLITSIRSTDKKQNFTESLNCAYLHYNSSYFDKQLIQDK